MASDQKLSEEFGTEQPTSEEFVMTNEEGILDTYTDAHIKHLEFLQAVISRLSTNSFLIKGWALTLTTATYALALDRGNVSLLWLAALPVLGFWVLDTYFVRKERQFRDLYTRAAQLPQSVPAFSMDISLAGSRKNHDWSRVAVSLTVGPIYALLAACGVIVSFVSTKG